MSSSTIVGTVTGIQTSQQTLGQALATIEGDVKQILDSLNIPGDGGNVPPTDLSDVLEALASLQAAIGSPSNGSIADALSQNLDAVNSLSTTINTLVSAVQDQSNTIASISTTVTSNATAINNVDANVTSVGTQITDLASQVTAWQSSISALANVIGDFESIPTTTTPRDKLIRRILASRIKQ